MRASLLRPVRLCRGDCVAVSRGMVKRTCCASSQTTFVLRAGRGPPSTHARLSSEWLPHTRQASWGLSLITSQSAHRTAFCNWIVFKSGFPDSMALVPWSLTLHSGRRTAGAVWFTFLVRRLIARLALAAGVQMGVFLQFHPSEQNTKTEPSSAAVSSRCGRCCCSSTAIRKT